MNFVNVCFDFLKISFLMCRCEFESPRQDGYFIWCEFSIRQIKYFNGSFITFRYIKVLELSLCSKKFLQRQIAADDSGNCRLLVVRSCFCGPASHCLILVVCCFSLLSLVE